MRSTVATCPDLPSFRIQHATAPSWGTFCEMVRPCGYLIQFQASMGHVVVLVNPMLQLGFCSRYAERPQQYPTQLASAEPGNHSGLPGTQGE